MTTHIKSKYDQTLFECNIDEEECIGEYEEDPNIERTFIFEPDEILEQIYNEAQDTMTVYHYNIQNGSFLYLEHPAVEDLTADAEVEVEYNNLDSEIKAAQKARKNLNDYIHEREHERELELELERERERELEHERELERERELELERRREHNRMLELEQSFRYEFEPGIDIDEEFDLRNATKHERYEREREILRNMRRNRDY